MKLNLGCGAKPEAGWLNHNLTPGPGVDVAFDLTVLPWPLLRYIGTVEHIQARDVLEHLPNLIPVFDECWRLLVPDGTMFVQVPEFGSYYHVADLTHCRGFCPDSFDILDPETMIGARNPWYTTRRWRIESKEQDTGPLATGRNLRFLLRKRG